jgi:hypothetical protein
MPAGPFNPAAALSKKRVFPGSCQKTHQKREPALISSKPE